jgi:hypothetical protein
MKAQRSSQGQNERGNSEDPPRGRLEMVVPQNIIERRHVDEDPARRQRGCHAEIIGSGGGRGDEHDFVPKQSWVQQGLLAALVGKRAKDRSDG